MTISDNMVLAIENELKDMVAQIPAQHGMENLTAMMAYHLGWEGDAEGPEARGKRIRPLLVTLCTAANKGEWRYSLPAAAAIELIHNFSLLHDDIEDNSPMRRGRPTIWKTWGISQAINTGDAMFALAHLSIFNLDHQLPASLTLECSKLLQQTCLVLTQGQYLDISYESKVGLTLDSYWQMISFKTAALVACSCEIGALLTKADRDQRQLYHEFGRNLGLAFQILDDILGVWGDSDTTGKSSESDLVTGKKSLPILFGISKHGEFAKSWPDGRVPIGQVSRASRILEDEGAKEFAQRHAAELTDKALRSLAEAKPTGPAGEELTQLARRLLGRRC